MSFLEKVNRVVNRGLIVCGYILYGFGAARMTLAAFMLYHGAPRTALACLAMASLNIVVGYIVLHVLVPFGRKRMRGSNEKITNNLNI